MLSLWVWELFPGYAVPCRNTNIRHWGRSYRMSFCAWSLIFFFPRVNTTFQFSGCIQISVQMSRCWDSLRGEFCFVVLTPTVKGRGKKKVEKRECENCYNLVHDFLETSPQVWNAQSASWLIRGSCFSLAVSRNSHRYFGEAITLFTGNARKIRCQTP